MKLGILGGGQLARMLALAAYPLGIDTICLDPSSEACAQDVTEVIISDYTDSKSLDKFLVDVDYVTFETENIPIECAELVSKSRPIYPSTEVLSVSQDRLHEKNFFKSLQIPTPAYRRVQSEQELKQAVSELGLPTILKTRRFGYDGKGQSILHTDSDLSNTAHLFQTSSLILEQFIAFKCEFSLISVRNKKGETRFYPLVQNQHKKGILFSSEAPFNDPDLQQQAENYARRILEKFQYVGVLTIEFFYDGKQLIINEMAPRVHNSGHWTIEGAATSQFENHLRAVFDLPLGSTEVSQNCFLLNCIGSMIPAQACVHIPGLHYHQYGKEPRPGRKLGHLTLVDSHSERYQKNKSALINILQPS